MKILIVLTYYRPHISGLTIYVERLARALADRGHRVTVLTSHYDPRLPRRQVMDGVEVLRHPVLFRASKGSIMPGFLSRAAVLMRQSDVISVHLPQAEGGPLALLGHAIARKPVVLTYHSDLQLPPGLVNRVIDRAVFLSNSMAGIFADRISAYTDDFANHSPYLSQFRSKIVVIPPPIQIEPPQPEAVAALKQRTHANGHAIVGFAARFAEEKGIDYLLESIPLVREQIPAVKYLLAGQYKQVIGENVWERLQPKIQQYREYLEFLGQVPVEEMSAFFGACDVLTVPSINSTETFGLVQVEAMLSGCPVVATNLPGVREPIRMTGMGQVVPIKDARALADGIVRVLQNRQEYLRPREQVAAMFAIERTVAAYETLFSGLQHA
ncbi:MAG: glycosyltransferase family 4 protein [Chloroflexi bacterium]|nr:glycosyltransferase family 4 protein [Chloroflexota bacterium]